MSFSCRSRQRVLGGQETRETLSIAHDGSSGLEFFEPCLYLLSSPRYQMRASRVKPPAQDLFLRGMSCFYIDSPGLV